MQVPTHIVRAFARAESSDGKKLVGPETPRWGRAEGIGMIIRAKFDEVNGQYFNGRLQWDSQADKALASLTLIKSLYDKYGESGLDKIAGEYHGGPGWSAEKSDGLTQTGEYIERIRQLSQHFKEVSAEG